MIRVATPGDHGAIAKIANQVIRETTISFNTIEKTVEDIADMAQSAPLLVAADEVEVLGYATFGPFRAGTGYSHVAEHSIALASGARGQGLGRALLVALERAAVTQGVAIFVAGVSSSNTAGLTFHKRLGFQVTGTMPGVGRKFGQILDLVLMQKTLDPPT